MNNFDKELVEIVARSLPPKATPADVIGWLARQGVTNNTSARRLVIKEYVDRQFASGKCSKADALFEAADHFGCSEYMARNYYYN